MAEYKHLPRIDSRGVGLCSDKCPFYLPKGVVRRADLCTHALKADQFTGACGQTSSSDICYPWAAECAAERNGNRAPF